MRAQTTKNAGRHRFSVETRYQKRSARRSHGTEVGLLTSRSRGRTPTTAPPKPASDVRTSGSSPADNHRRIQFLSFVCLKDSAKTRHFLLPFGDGGPSCSNRCCRSAARLRQFPCQDLLSILEYSGILERSCSWVVLCYVLCNYFETHTS